MPRKKPASRSEPTPMDEGAQILEAAAKAGADYAMEQVDGEHFRDWVYDQMLEAERMRKADPSSVFPADTPAGAKRAARNMLQQLEWDTKRQMDQREIIDLSGAKGVFESGSVSWVKDTYGITVHDVTSAFFDSFVETLNSPSAREWLAEEVLTRIQELRGGSESTRVLESTTPTEQQLVDYFIFNAEDVDVGTFSRAKTDEVAAHFGIDSEKAFRALGALARRGLLKKTRDVMKRHRGKTAVGYQWWEYGWKPGDLARYEASADSLREPARARGHRVADFSTLPEVIEHAGRQGGATHVRVAGAGTTILYPLDGGKYEEAKVWRQGGYWHGQAPGDRTIVNRLPSGAQLIDDYLARGWQKTAETRRQRAAPRRR
jgi:hypothetical protein